MKSKHEPTLNMIVKNLYLVKNRHHVWAQNTGHPDLHFKKILWTTRMNTRCSRMHLSIHVADRCKWIILICKSIAHLCRMLAPAHHSIKIQWSRAQTKSCSPQDHSLWRERHKHSNCIQSQLVWINKKETKHCSIIYLLQICSLLNMIHI